MDLNICELIKQYENKEADFFDFKVEWHKSQDDLIKDILHLANAFTSRQEKYLILGVANNGSIQGINESTKSFSEHQITNTLHSHQLNRSLGLSIREQLINNSKKIHILIIKTEDENKPYFLQKDYKAVKASVIYTRKNSSNCVADDRDAESLWKYRLNLHLTPSEKIEKYLEDKSNWIKKNIDNNEEKTIYYYRLFPEFRIETSKTPFKEYLGKEAQRFPDNQTKNERIQVLLMFNTTPIDEYYFIYYDGFRYLMPQPDFEFNETKGELEYFYNKEKHKMWLHIAEIFFLGGSSYNPNPFFWRYSKIRIKQ